MRLIAKDARGQKFQNDGWTSPRSNLHSRRTTDFCIRCIRLIPLLIGAMLFQGHAYAKIPYVRTPWMRFTATAYSVSGETKAQTITEEGRTVAADPDVLPIGTVIEIQNAGPYSGQYVVADTGEKIIGRKIDIYIASTHEAIRFGKRGIKVRVIQRAPETPRARRKAAAEASIAPKPPKSERVSEYYQYPRNTGGGESASVE